MTPLKYRFFRAGAVEQLFIENDHDLEALLNLNPKLWMATSMPCTELEFDAKTLAFIDLDGDGRIRIPELKAAVVFVRENLQDTQSFFSGKDVIPLSAIAQGVPAREAALHVLEHVPGTSAEGIALSQVEEAFKQFDSRPFNGDGILVLASAGENAAAKNLIEAIALVTGGTVDSAGNLGITKEQVDEFIATGTAYLEWQACAKSEAEKIFPLGDEQEMSKAWGALIAIREKVEDFFARVRLASFEPESLAALNSGDKKIADLLVNDITASVSKSFPLARIKIESGEPVLPLVEGVNPAWASELLALRDCALVPALGMPKDALLMTESQWKNLLAFFAPYGAWLGKKPAGSIHKLDCPQIESLLELAPKEYLAPLFEQDCAEKPMRTALRDLERLCCYSRNLLCLLRNYVSFADFYSLSRNTVFLAGTLYLDRRSCSLCIRVADAGKHAALATKSNCCLVYCNCTRRSDGKSMTLVAVFGDGDSEYLSVGRNGVFFDKSGKDWDATVIKVVEQPISVRQAFWSPYKKLARFVETQISNFAAAREKKVEGEMNSNVTQTAGTLNSTQKPAFDVAKFAGIFAAIGLAIGAIGGALATLGSEFMALSWWQMPLVILGVILLISLPSMLLAAMKLRHRTLGPILDANSWAINGRAKINIPLGKAYTELPKKPANAYTFGNDPFPQKKFSFKLVAGICGVLFILLVLLFSILLFVSAESIFEQSVENIFPKAVSAQVEECNLAK